jgi:hypothetical protein
MPNGLGRHDVILGESDEKHRRPARVLEVDGHRCMAHEVREGAFLQDLVGAGHRVSVADLVRLLLAERVCKGVVELLLVETAVLLEGVGEQRRRRADRREWQVAYALDGRRGDADARRADSAIEQDLREASAERVAHDDRRSVEPANDALVVSTIVSTSSFSSADGSAFNASTSTSIPGHAGARTLYPLSSYRSAQCSQLRGVIQSPWMSTMVFGVAVMNRSFRGGGATVQARAWHCACSGTRGGRPAAGPPAARIRS